jgi:uncharacterized RDD family membrane protein YckC
LCALSGRENDLTETAAMGDERLRDLDKETAGLLRRGFAHLIDNLLFAPIVLALSLPALLSGADDSGTFMLLSEADFWRIGIVDGLMFIYAVVMLGRYSRTIGMMALKIRVTNLDGSVIRFRRALWRTAVFWFPFVLSLLLFFHQYEAGYLLVNALTVIGLMWMVVDKKHQGYHDKIANTLVMRDTCCTKMKTSL